MLSVNVGTLIIVQLSFFVESATSLGISCDNADPSFLVCLPNNYSKYEIPVKKGVNQIDVSIHLDEITKVDEKDYKVTIMLFLEVKWKDPRIILGKEFFRPSAAQGEEGVVPVSIDLRDDFWLPDIFIYKVIYIRYLILMP